MTVALRFGGSILTAVLLVGCGNAALRAAEHGDRARLASELAGPHARGEISNGEAADLAHAVAVRELEEADEASLASRIRDVAPCAHELRSTLDTRAEKHDGNGAEAALVLQAASEGSDGKARAYVGDPDPGWRAVGARTLVRRDDQKARREAMVDPDERVRRNAMTASAESDDASDLDLLLETASVDPDVLVRLAALRAVSKLVKVAEPAPRVADVALRLRDVWNAKSDALGESGGETLRQGVAAAWSLSPLFESGGREALRAVIAEGKGKGALGAAGAVIGSGHDDPELEASASALLVRSILEGPSRDRVLAVVFARLTGAELDALRKVASDDDREVRVAALGRLLGSKPDRDASIRALETFAGQGTRGAPSNDRTTLLLAARARRLLAQAGDLRVQAWIEEDLNSPDIFRKLDAAASLSALGRSGRAAMLLTDADARVRTGAACTMMRGAR